MSPEARRAAKPRDAEVIPIAPAIEKKAAEDAQKEMRNNVNAIRVLLDEEQIPISDTRRSIILKTAEERAGRTLRTPGEIKAARQIFEQLKREAAKLVNDKKVREQEAAKATGKPTDIEQQVNAHEPVAAKENLGTASEATASGTAEARDAAAALSIPYRDAPADAEQAAPSDNRKEREEIRTHLGRSRGRAKQGRAQSPEFTELKNALAAHQAEEARQAAWRTYPPEKRAESLQATMRKMSDAGFQEFSGALTLEDGRRENGAPLPTDARPGELAHFFSHATPEQLSEVRRAVSAEALARKLRPNTERAEEAPTPPTAEIDALHEYVRNTSNYNLRILNDLVALERQRRENGNPMPQAERGSLQSVLAGASVEDFQTLESLVATEIQERADRNEEHRRTLVDRRAEPSPEPRAMSPEPPPHGPRDITDMPVEPMDPSVRFAETGGSALWRLFVKPVKEWFGEKIPHTFVGRAFAALQRAEIKMVYAPNIAFNEGLYRLYDIRAHRRETQVHNLSGELKTLEAQQAQKQHSLDALRAAPKRSMWTERRLQRELDKLQTSIYAKRTQHDHYAARLDRLNGAKERWSNAQRAIVDHIASEAFANSAPYRRRFAELDSRHTEAQGEIEKLEERATKYAQRIHDLEVELGSVKDRTQRQELRERLKEGNRLLKGLRGHLLRLRGTGRSVSAKQHRVDLQLGKWNNFVNSYGNRTAQRRSAPSYDRQHEAPDTQTRQRRNFNNRPMRP